MFKSISIVLFSFGLVSAALAVQGQYGMSLQTELTTADNGAVTTVPQASVDRT